MASPLADRLRPKALVTRTISLDEAPAAMEALGRPSTAGGLTIIRP